MRGLQIILCISAFICHMQIIHSMLHADHSLYVIKSDVGIVLITIYVDDLIIVGDSETHHVKGLLKQEFEMKDLGELRYFLGIEVIRTAAGIWLSQRQYALDMLSKYGMGDCKPISMPLHVNVKLSTHAGDALENVTMYRKIVGSLIYLTITRLDLSYTQWAWRASLCWLQRSHIWMQCDTRCTICER